MPTSPFLRWLGKLELTDQSNDIFKLSSILHTKTKIEEPYKLKLISQCLNCQDYGHTRSDCGYSTRFVRCGDSHSSCTKLRDSPPKCALCLDNHPANYRGCNAELSLTIKVTFYMIMLILSLQLIIVAIIILTPTPLSSSQKTYAQATIIQRSHSYNFQWILFIWY